MFHPAQDESYKGVVPADGTEPSQRKPGKPITSSALKHIARQRLSRVVRETLSFSKKLAHHIRAIKYFICHYNLTRAAALPL